MTLFCALASNFLFASGHDSQRCTELIALAVMAIVVLARAKRNHVIPGSTPTITLLTGFFVLGLASATAALSLRHAAYEWSVLLMLLVMVFAIATELTHERVHLASLLHLIGIACGLYSLRIVLMYAAALASGFQPDWSVIAVGFSNLRHLNHTQTALLPLIILLVMNAPKDGMWRKTWFLLAAFWWSLLFVTEARASIIALAASCTAAFALRRSHARKFIFTMGLTASFGVILYGMLFILLPEMAGLSPISTPLNVLDRTAANPSSNRNILWKFAWELIMAHPLLGIGPQHFAHDAAGLHTGAHPHNWPLQIAAEWGIPALLCLLGAIFLGARALVRSGARLTSNDLPNQQMLVTMLVACMAIFVDGLFSGGIVMPQSQLAIALVLGMACAWVRVQAAEQQDESTPSRAKRTAMSIVVATGLCGLLWSVMPDILHFLHSGKPTSGEHIGLPGMLWPRMWEDGNF